MAMDLSAVLTGGVAGAGAAIPVAKYLYERWIGFRLDRELKRHENVLAKQMEGYKSALGQQTEVLKSHLAIYAHEQIVAMSRFDAQRAKAIESAYTELCGLIAIFRSAVALSAENAAAEEGGFQQYFNREVVAIKDAYRQYCDSVERHAIFFDDATQQVLGNARTIARQLLLLFSGTEDTARGGAALNLAPVASPRPFNEVRELVAKRVEDDLSPIRERLVPIFRAVLRGENRLASLTLPPINGQPDGSRSA